MWVTSAGARPSAGGCGQGSALHNPVICPPLPPIPDGCGHTGLLALPYPAYAVLAYLAALCASYRHRNVSAHHPIGPLPPSAGAPCRDAVASVTVDGVPWTHFGYNEAGPLLAVTGLSALAAADGGANSSSAAAPVAAPAAAALPSSRTVCITLKPEDRK